MHFLKFDKLLFLYIYGLKVKNVNVLSEKKLIILGNEVVKD